jgi:hypothetical protein
MEHPDALRKAQAEIDKIVGTDRLPTFSDRAALPYGKCASIPFIRTDFAEQRH